MIKVLYGKEACKRMKEFIPASKEKLWINANGFFNPPEGEVYIFNSKKTDDMTVGILAHEIRHAHQFFIKYHDFKFEEDWYSLKDEFYECRKTELDANTFAYEYCLKNKLSKKVIRHYQKKMNKNTRARRKHKHICP